MNVRAATFAAGGGVLALCSFVMAFFVFFFSFALGGGFSLFGSVEYSAPGLLGMLVLAPGIAAAGGALPARALGASWPLSVLASSVPVGIFFWGLYVRLMEPGFPKWMTATAALGAALVTLVGSMGRGVSLWGMLLVVAGAAGLSTAAVVFQQAASSTPSGTDPWGSIAAIVLAWVSLPALAGAFLPPGEQEGERLRRVARWLFEE